MQYIAIQAKRGNKEYDVLISPEDLPLVQKYRWYIDPNGYAQGAIKGKRGKYIRIHRLLMNPSKGFEVDHINRDKLDNRRENLRVVTHHLNTLNRPKGEGIQYDADRGKWRARLVFKNKDIHLGRYDTKEDALMARAFAELFYWDGLRLSAF